MIAFAVEIGPRKPGLDVRRSGLRYLFLFLLAVPFQVEAATPAPPYPPTALAKGERGRVELTVDFATDGTAVHCRVAKSCGSAELDDYTRNFILKNWTDVQHAGKTVSVPIDYEPPSGIPGGLPAPGYPYSAWSKHESGTVWITVGFDAKGNVASCKIAKSSGYEDLDSWTVNFIRGRWSNSAVAGKTCTIPIRYQLAQ